MDNNLSSDQAKQLLAVAQEASSQAYAPYSRFQVGAAVLTKTDTVYTGANVENASYGLTVCAERVALCKALSEGERHFQAVAVWAESAPYGHVVPCGACLQVLSEFLSPEAVIITSLSPLSPEGHLESGNVETQQVHQCVQTPFAKLFPVVFRPAR